MKKEIVDEFHKAYHASGIEGQCYWLGQRMYKLPQDLFIMQEIIFETRPNLIIEIGTWRGGSALFFATVLDALNFGKVLTIDIAPLEMPSHKRIEYLQGSSLDEKTINQVRNHISNNDRVMVILDSDHTMEHVRKEMESYYHFVTKGCYMIVEDTCLNGHPVDPEFGLGPMEAIRSFKEDHPLEFENDRSREKYFLTYDRSGFLKKL